MAVIFKQKNMSEFNGVTLEKYANLCALMTNTNGDESKEIEIATKEGVSAEDWKVAKEGFTALMRDPADMGKTALEFMPLLQEAQTRLRGGAEPCSVEDYARIKAAMAFTIDPETNEKIDYMKVLEENGYTHQAWIECENYWTPVVAKDETKPTLLERFNEEKSAIFEQIVKAEEKRIVESQS